MALYRHKYVESADPRRPGITTFIVLPDLEEIRCAVCGDEAVPNVCHADTQRHYHGQVHINGKLTALCQKHGGSSRAQALTTDALTLQKDIE